MYYPKSQIKPNLYTNGNEYILSTSKTEYKGYYYEISTGQLYTGKNPSTKPNILLLPIIINSVPALTQNFPLDSYLVTIPVAPIIQNPLIPNGEDTPLNYNLFNSYPKRNEFKNRLMPIFNPTLPTDQDKQNGQFNRYFCKKTNELKYLEIDKETHTKLQTKDLQIAWDLYEPASLLWVIKGNQETVFNTNKASVFKIEQNQKWNGFPQYFKENYLKYHPSQDTELAAKNQAKENYLKYYQIKDINNLYTPGGEFTTKNGQNYIGFYHIHKGTIPMVGKTHTQYFHETLYPTQLSLNKNSKFSQILASIALVEALPANSNIDNLNNLNNIITLDNPIFFPLEALDTNFLTKPDPYKQDPYKPDPYKPDPYKQDQ